MTCTPSTRLLLDGVAVRCSDRASWSARPRRHRKGLTGRCARRYPVAENPIAVLRIDGNFYDSYQDAMYYLYEYVPVGGFVIFDDYFTHPPVQR